MRAFFFNAAGNQVVLGLIQSAGITSGEGFGLLRSAACTPLAASRPDMYGVLSREQGQLRARFWNPDGSQEDICANGLRCVPLVLGALGEPSDRVLCHTGIGPVTCIRMGPGIGGVELPLAWTSQTVVDDDLLVNVGTPHRVRFVDDLDAPELVELGRSWAGAALAVAATFVRVVDGVLHVRSIERGVVRETGSSGTAALAAYLAYDRREHAAHRDFRDVLFPGGNRLRVRRDASDNITLYGSCRPEFSCDLVTEGERIAAG